MQNTIDIYSLITALPDAKRVQIETGATLFQHGDKCENFVVVMSGSVRVELLSADGDMLLLYRIKDGESCIMTTSCLLSDNNYAAQAITESNVDLLMLPRSVFHTELDKSSQFRAFLFDGFSDRLGKLMSRIGNITTQTIDQRLALVLIDKHQSESHTDSLEITHSELASEIGTSREVVSRRLAVFEKNGIVERNRGHVRITNIQALQLHTKST